MKKFTNMFHWTRILAMGLLAALTAVFIYQGFFWANHACLGYDIDFENGRILQGYSGSANRNKLQLSDRILSINHQTLEQFNPHEQLIIGEWYAVMVEEADGMRPVQLLAEKNSGLLYVEHMILPLLGIIFYLFGFVLLMVRKPDAVSIAFLVFTFFSSLNFIGLAYSHYMGGNLSFWYLLVMIATAFVVVYFYWCLLEIKLLSGFIKNLAAIFGTLLIAFVITYWHYPESGLYHDKTIFYGLWCISFLIIFFFFIFQYVYDALARGSLRILFLTFLIGFGPLVYFLLIPLILANPRPIPLLTLMVPVMLVPFNDFLLIQRKKSWVKVVCSGIAFLITLAAAVVVTQMGAAVLPQLLPGYHFFGQDWLSYALTVLIIGGCIFLYQGVNNMVRRMVYGNAQLEAENMQRLSQEILHEQDSEMVLMQTGRVFIEFFNFLYLHVCLQDGTIIRFMGSNEDELQKVDHLEVLDVLNQVMFHNAHDQRKTDPGLFIQLKDAEQLMRAHPAIFGPAAEYCFLLQGRSYPVGLICAGGRINGERFDPIEIQQLEALLHQYQAIVENLFLIEEVEKRSLLVRRMGQQILEAREDERKRIARDMHDNIIQSITAFRYTMNDLYDKDKMNITDEEADNLQRSLQTISQDIRDICFNLRPPALDATGFRSAVVSIVESFNRDDRMHVHLEISDRPVIDQLSEMVSICLYRVAQEALTNIEKHAGTKDAWVVLDGTETGVQLVVEDNGVGFEVPENISELVAAGHFGLTGIQEFLEIVNGTLKIDSATNGGCILIAQIPLRKVEGEHGLYYDCSR